MFTHARDVRLYGGEYTNVGRDFHQTNQTVNNYHGQQPPGSDPEARNRKGVSPIGLKNISCTDDTGNSYGETLRPYSA